MPSSYTASARFILQATGENNNTWGALLNAGAFQLIDTAICGRLAFTLSGSKTLTTALGATDEARNAILDVTGGSGGTIIVPSVSKLYVVRNNAAGPVVVQTAGGVIMSSVAAGECVALMCDASNVQPIFANDFGLAVLHNAGNPTSPQDVATKAYADALAFTANAGILPGQTGANGWALFSNGTNALWKQIATTDVANLANTINASAIAFALAFGGS